MLLSLSLHIKQPLRVIIENSETLFDWIKQPSSIVALSAVVVSLAGLIISATHNRRTLKRQEKLNEKMVEPELTLHGNHTYTDEKDNEFKSFLRIRNSGLGPARIKSFTLIYGNETFPDLSRIFMVYHPVFIKAMDLKKCEHMTDIPGTTLAQNEDLYIFKNYYSLKTTEKVLLLERLSQIEVKIDHTSMFDKHKVLHAKILGN